MDRNIDGKDQYRFNWRARHTTVIVREVLYCWGGDQGLDESQCDCSGDFPKKKEHISVIDEFDFSSGVWSSQPTRGTPPLGIRGVSCTTINNNIYYFGGFCGHGKCYHNSLNCLDTVALQWKELQPTGDNSVTKKGYGGMIAMGSEGEPQQLLVIGGLAPKSTTTEYHQFEYHKIPSRVDRLRTNEQNIYNLSTGQWVVPFVSGQCFPPTDNFTIERINHNKGIIYGGSVTDDGRSIPTNSIYLFRLSRNTINWESLSKGAIPNDGLWTKERYAHASTIINGVSTSPTLVVIGGVDNYEELVNECLLLDTNQYNWMKIPLPDSVTGRYYHTVSSFVVDPNHVFLIIMGGYAKREQEAIGGEIKLINKRITYSSITMVVELVFYDGQWSVESVNSGLSRMNNQLLQEELLKIKSEKRMLEKQLHVLDTKTLLTKRKRDQELDVSPHSDNTKKFKTDESVEEKQIITDELEDNEERTAKFAENEVYMTEIEDEKKQVQIIKETSSVEVQFNYLIPSMDNLECLSDVQVAEKKLFLIQGDKPQLMNWEKYGLRIGVQEGSLLSSETVEAVAVALVGGQFQFPPNTVLVSAVYAVSLSKPLLKRLKLEIQHCVDLTGRPGLSRYLKFAIAPVSTPSLPYQFSIVEGGEFSSNSGYGSIQRKEFCLVCILGEEWTNGDSDSEDDGNGSNDDSSIHSSDSSSGSDKTGGPPGASDGAANEPNQEEEEEEGDQELGEKTEAVTEGAATPLTVSDSKNESDPSTTDKLKGVGKVITYTGMLYYEKDGVEDLVTFTAAKKLNALIKYIRKNHSHAKAGQHAYFRFKDEDGCIELNFDTPQDEPVTGWDIKPHIRPCRLYRCDVNNFGSKDYPLPPSCLISVYGSPDAVPTLHYSIPLEGVADPVTFYIHRSLRTVPPPPSTDPTTSSSSSNVVHESTSVSSTGGASPSATVDVNKVKKVINDVLVSHYADLNSLKTSLSDLASQLYAAHLISDEVRETRSMEKFITEFKASLSFKRKLPKVEEHCQKFLSSFIAVRGSYADAAIALGEDWIETIKKELGFDFNIDIDA